LKRTLAIAGLMLASAGVVIANPASADVRVHTPVCSLDAIVQTTVAQLHSPVPFIVTTTRKDAYGVAKRDRVLVSRETPCDYDLVTSVVRHEYMHVLQYRVNAFPDDFEQIADCGSRMLGSKVTPYIGKNECSDVQMTQVRDLLKLSAHVDM
jgi:hypothetical protein